MTKPVIAARNLCERGSGEESVHAERRLLSQIGQRLLEKWLIYATEDCGVDDFTIPRFDEYMRRHVPYRPAWHDLPLNPDSVLRVGYLLNRVRRV